MQRGIHARTMEHQNNGIPLLLILWPLPDGMFCLSSITLRSDRNRGIVKQNLAITRQTAMPAVLVEGGFMDGVNDSPQAMRYNKPKKGGYKMVK